MRLVLLTTGLIVGLFTTTARADDQVCSCCEDGYQRAGQPQKVSCLARPSESKHYGGYYAGGGALVGGDCRCATDGTWGWDYGMSILPHRVALKWWHGRRYQGGTGAYKTDGPHVPDVPRIIGTGIGNVRSGKSFHGDD